jgi:hypothetical protein
LKRISKEIIKGFTRIHPYQGFALGCLGAIMVSVAYMGFAFSSPHKYEGCAVLVATYVALLLNIAIDHSDLGR